ncbi:MAG: hypothetical protein DMF92_02255 [Acidobacteria bacterium]|nr:MAG: hypothetical protein DMF92_02255 [Acidobacteriota bacterium]
MTVGVRVRLPRVVSRSAAELPRIVVAIARLGLPPVVIAIERIVLVRGPAIPVRDEAFLVAGVAVARVEIHRAILRFSGTTSV